MQKSQNQNDFHSELTATVANSRRQRQAGGIGQITDVVSQVDGSAIDNSPRRLEAMMNALAAINAFRKDGNRFADEMFFGFSRLSTGRFLWRLLVGVFATEFVGVEEFVAIETVVLREDGLLRRLGIELGGQQGFQSLDSLLELLVFFSELLVFLGQLSKKSRLLSDLQIPWIDLLWGSVRHDERVTNLSILRNPNRKWAATPLAVQYPAKWAR